MSHAHTSPHLTTPFTNPLEDVTEIEVTDPTHPLFGRRFPVHAIEPSQRGSTHILVTYQASMLLRIPLVATNLSAPRPTRPTKLTADAVAELVTLAEHCEALCPFIHMTSGPDSRPTNTSESAPISVASSRR